MGHLNGGLDPLHWRNKVNLHWLVIVALASALLSCTHDSPRAPFRLQEYANAATPVPHVDQLPLGQISGDQYRLRVSPDILNEFIKAGMKLQVTVSPRAGTTFEGTLYAWVRGERIGVVEQHTAAITLSRGERKEVELPFWEVTVVNDAPRTDVTLWRYSLSFGVVSKAGATKDGLLVHDIVLAPESMRTIRKRHNDFIRRATHARN